VVKQYTYMATGNHFNSNSTIKVKFQIEVV